MQIQSEDTIVDRTAVNDWNKLPLNLIELTDSFINELQSLL